MKHRIYILFAMFIAMSSCTKEEGDPKNLHTLLVYIGTDNNLSGFGQEKIDAIAQNFNPQQGRIVVFIDNNGEEAQLYEITKNTAGKTVINDYKSYPNANSASKELFSYVITDVLRSFSSDSYGLLVFSHASGWLPQGAYTQLSQGRLPNPAYSDDKTKSLIIDGSSEMEMAEFAAAIPDGMFDYIVFETCFMAGIEIAYELRHKTKYIFASSAEIVHPGYAPAYPAALSKLLSGALDEFGQRVFDHVLTYNESNASRSATYSVISTAGLEALALFIRQNCDFTKPVDIQEIQHFDRLGNYRLFFDFEDYFFRLLETGEQKAELSRLIADCVTWKAATNKFMSQFTITKHSGLTTYIPQEQFSGLNEQYQQTVWAKAIK